MKHRKLDNKLKNYRSCCFIWNEKRNFSCAIADDADVYDGISPFTCRMIRIKYCPECGQEFVYA